jgi:hypothetical protein
MNARYTIVTTKHGYLIKDTVKDLVLASMLYPSEAAVNKVVLKMNAQEEARLENTASNFSVVRQADSKRSA